MKKQTFALYINSIAGVFSLIFLTLTNLSSLNAQNNIKLNSKEELKTKLDWNHSSKLNNLSDVTNIVSTQNTEKNQLWAVGKSTKGSGILVKLNENGEILKSIVLNTKNSVEAIAVKSNGNVIISYSQQKENKSITLLSEFNENGVKIHSQILGENIEPNSLKIDNQNNVYICGGTISREKEQSCLWVLKLDSNHHKVWEYKAKAGNSATLFDLSISKSGEVFAGGWYNGTFNNETSKDGSDGILVKISKEGVLNWSKSIKGLDFQAIRGIDLDENNNVYISGWFWNEISFTSSLSNSDNNYTLKSNGAGDIFIAKYSSEGQFNWSKSFGGAGNDASFRLSYQNNHVIASGWFGNNMMIDGQNFSAKSERDAFILNLNTEGKINNFLSLELGNKDNGGFALTQTSNGEIWLAGYTETDQSINSTGWIAMANNNLLSNTPKLPTVNLSSTKESNEPKLVQNNFQFYPNPAINQINLRFDLDNTNSQSHQIIIYDVTGKLVFTKELTVDEINSQMCSINVESFNRGYFVIVLTENEKVLISQKFILE